MLGMNFWTGHKVLAASFNLNIKRPFCSTGDDRPVSYYSIKFVKNSEIGLEGESGVSKIIKILKPIPKPKDIRFGSIKNELLIA